MTFETASYGRFQAIILPDFRHQAHLQQDDPLLDFIPNFKDLRCDQIDSHFIKVNTTFFNAIRDVGNATSDLKSTTREVSDLSSALLSSPTDIACAINDPSGTKVFDVSKYLATKQIAQLLSQEPPENYAVLKGFIGKYFIATIALIFAEEHHYSTHFKQQLETCPLSVNFFEDFLCQRRLSYAKESFNRIDLNTMDINVVSCAREAAKIINTRIKFATKDDATRRNWNRRTRHIEKKKKEADHTGRHRSDLIATFITLLHLPEAIDRLVAFTLFPNKQDKDFYAVIEGFINDQKQKKVDEAAASLLKEVEEEKQKTSHRKRQPPKKSTKSLDQAAASLPSPSSSVVEKQPLLDQATRPKETAQTSAALYLRKELDQVIIDKLFLHSRIAQWERATPETIKKIQKWDHKTNKLIYPYATDPNPDYMIASHNLGPIKRFLKSRLAKRYAQEYKFLDADKTTRKGWALVADMRWHGKEYKGAIFAARGDDDVLYHAQFKEFIEYTHNAMTNRICEQLLEVSYATRAVVDSESNNREWNVQGTFSFEEAQPEDKLLLLMTNRKKDLTFAFYPLY